MTIVNEGLIPSDANAGQLKRTGGVSGIHLPAAANGTIKACERNSHLDTSFRPEALGLHNTYDNELPRDLSSLVPVHVCMCK